MFGIEPTLILALGSLSLSVLIAPSKLVLKLATDVIVSSPLVQTSFAPISIITYSTLCVTDAFTCPDRLLILAPDLASLNSLPLIPAFLSRMRR